ncbi:MAG: Gldg family protein [Bacteroidota bacterium]|nr:Gldg family protein [Bacteroidota bacterium]
MNPKLLKIGLILLGFIIINILANQFFFRIDLTENKEYTLSKATKEILKNLDEKVSITAYFSDDLPIDILKSREELEDLLKEYASLSKGQLEFKFVAPNKDAALEQEAAKEGIQPVMINVREKDQAKSQKAFLGAVIKVGERKEIIPVIQPGTAMEYGMTTSIKKLAGKNKPFIGFVQGHGEPPLQELAQVYQELDILYKVESVYINDTVDLKKYKTLVMIRSMDSIPDLQFQKIDDYLANGGKFVVAFNHVDANLQYGLTNVVNTGLKNWLMSKGLLVRDALVRDVVCGQVQVQQNAGSFSFATPVQFPYLPLIQKFSDHPTTKGLERVILQFASPLEYQGDVNKRFTPILFSSDQSAYDTIPVVFDINKQWTRQEFTQKYITMGAVLEGKFGSEITSQMIVFTDGDFPVGGQGRSQQVNADNISLLVNSIDWLSDDTGLIDLRTKAVATRPIGDLDDATRSMYKYINFLLPIGLVIGYGLFRFSLNRRKRMERMEERYS